MFSQDNSTPIAHHVQPQIDLVDRLRQNVPPELLRRPQWVTWRYEERGGKETKVLYCPQTGRRADSTDPATWASFDDACTTYQSGGYDGLGFCFSPDDRYVGVDLDHCISEAIGDNGIDPVRLEWIQQLDSYSEISPSGTGVHVICRGTLPGKGRRNSKLGTEMYDRAHYFTMTGDRLPGTPKPIYDRQPAIDTLYQAWFPAKDEQQNSSTVGAQHAVSVEDDELLRRMFASRHGAEIERLWNGDTSAHNGDDSAADLALCNWLAFFTGRDGERMDRLFRQSGLYRPKWERKDYREHTIALAIAGTVNTYRPVDRGNPEELVMHHNGNGASATTTPQTGIPLDYTGPAIWRNRDHDQPVEVLGHMGDAGGVSFFRIEGSTTGVPGPELAIPDPPIKTALPGKATVIREALFSMGHAFRLNLVRERIEHADGRPLHDGEQAAIIAALYDRGFSNKQLMQDVILAEAWDRRYDPLRDFLTELLWDGQDHIARLCYYFEDRHPAIEYPNGRSSRVFDAWLRHWLPGAVGKALAQPVQNPMLVLAGDQDLGKSEFPKWLCSPLPGYFVESAINPESVDHQRWATGNFIWAVDELGATTRKADVEALKGFITRHEHSFRVPYAKNEVHKPARASYVGTVNPDNAGFLTDATGNRRFLTVEVTSIDWRGYTANVDPRQVWAQAVALYRQNPDSWKLDTIERTVRDGINSEFNVEDPVRDAILALFDVTPNARTDDPGVSFTSNADLVFHVGTQVRTASTKVLQMEVARALKKLNVTKGRRNDIRGYYGIRRQPANLTPTSEA